MYPTPPSFVKLHAMLSGVVIGAGIFAPSSDHVPEERNGAFSAIGMPSTALAVSCVAQRTTLVCPPTSRATSGVNCPKTVPGCVRRGKRRSGRDKARRISGSYSFVAALTSPVEVAFVYSRAFTPQSRYSRYSGTIRKSSACCKRPVFASS